MFLAFFATWMIQLLIGITVRNPLTVVLFVCLYLLNREVSKYEWKFDKRITASIAGLLAVLLTLLNRQSVVERFDSSIFKLLATGILAVGFYCFIYIAEKALLIFVIDKNRQKKNVDLPKNRFISSLINKYYEVFDSSNKVFILAFILILVGWLPYFLYEFPGIMTADSLVQYEQIAGLRPYSNHHPMIHTLIIKLFFNIGCIFTDNISAAMSFYTVFQMIFFAGCLATAVRKIRVLLDKNGFWYEILSVFFFAFVPFNAVFAVTIWKDIPFAGITVLLTCKLIDLEKEYDNIQVVDWLQLGLLCTLFALFRSNAWYSFIIWIPVFVFVFRKYLKSALAMSVVVFVLVFTIKGPVFDHFGVEKPDFVESLSVPTAQIARVLVNDRELTDEQQLLVDSVIDTTYIHELYAPDYADNIKELVRAGNVKYLENNKGKYLKLWFQLGIKYFSDYVSAWFDLLGGYVYPDFSYAVGDIDGIMGNDYGLMWTPIIGGRAIVKIKEIAIKLGGFVPVYGMLWSIGTYFWLLAVSIIMFIKNRQRAAEAWLLLLMMCTLLIAAPNLEFRYAYSLTLVWTLLFSKAKSSKMLDSSLVV